jgi:hypothetical protein
VVLSLLLAVAVRVPVSAAPAVQTVRQGETAAVTQPGSQERLRRDIEQKYRVALLQNGIVLIPRDGSRGISSIELSDGGVSIDGSAVTGRELRGRLGRDADLVLALSYLDPATRREMFKAAAPEKPPVAEPPVSVPPTEVSPEVTPPAVPEGDVIRTRRHPSDARIRVGGSINVREDEVVNGPVVAVGGSATIDGAVEDNVVAIGGNVKLGPRADVSGDVVAVGGTVDRDPAAKVGGRISDIAVGMPNIHLRPIRVWPFGLRGNVFGPAFGLFLSVFRMLLIAVLVLLAALIAHRPVERIADVVRAEPWKAGLVGLLAQLFVLPVLLLTVVILAVSIIGIPFLIVVPPLMILALLVAFIIGFAGVAVSIGRLSGSGLLWRVQGPFAVVLIGLLAIWIVTLSGRIVSLAGWPVWIVSATLLTVGFFVEYVAWTVGLGAALMTRFGNRPATVPPPVPPPLPPAT